MTLPPIAEPKVDRVKAQAHSQASARLIGLAFTVAVFVSAALLFVIEPMFGKMVLPLLGGSPAVWTTCMLFFQGALLLGYLYAHLGPRWLGVRRHAVMHMVLLVLSLTLLPIGVAETSGSFHLEHPTLWLLLVLTLSLGAPFVLLSSTGPLLQVWFSRSSHPQAHSPYFLYAASNAGSLLALLSYPFLLEPRITLREQGTLWALGYVGLVVLVTAAAVYGQGRTTSLDEAPVSGTSGTGIRMRTRIRWIILAFVPSSFFLALTTYATTDVAAVPLLWVVPLVLYLLSFTLVFGRRVVVPWTKLVRWQVVGLITVVIIDFWGPSGTAPWLLPLHLMVFFVTALVCHGELAATKPPAAHLTEFYLCLALGGLLGGVFNALVAPALFDSVLEYSLTLLAAGAVLPRRAGQSAPGPLGRDLALIAGGCVVLVATRTAIGDGPGLWAALISSAVVGVLCLRMSSDSIRFALAIAGVIVAGIVVRTARSGVLLSERNFFGVREVREDAQARMRVLMHGITKHGGQSTDPARQMDPPSYYTRQGPVGDIFAALPSRPGRRVAVVGLGAGALAAYGASGEEWVFFEIDPDIARVARDTNYFTYLRDTPARVDIILGDGRLSLAQVPSRHYDLLVIDAFSSDAIPTHLLTLEALSVYRSKLSENGVLVFHLSNRNLDLEPVLGRLVQSASLSGLIRENTGRTRELLGFSGDPSIWAAAASHGSNLGRLAEDERWHPLRVRAGVSLWTDDFSNIFGVFRWP